VTDRWPAGLLAGFDLETTSASPHEALPVSYAIVRFDFGQPTKGKTGLIDPGVEVPEEATKIHGITTDRVRSEGQPIEEAVPEICATLLKARDAGAPIVGMNIAYDLTIMDRLSRQIMGTPLPDLAPVLDLYVMDKHYDKWRKGKRTLTDLAAHYGVEMGEAHDAVADVEAAVRCVLALVDKHPGIARFDPKHLHDWQVKWSLAQNEDFSAYRVKQGGKPLDPWDFGWPIRNALPGSPVDSAAAEG